MLAVVTATAVLLGLVVALLAVPVVLVIDAERGDTLEARWRLRWLFGLVDVRSSRGRPPVSASEPSHAGRIPRKSVHKRRRGARMGIAALRTRGLLQRVGRLVFALRQRVKFEECYLRLAFGFDDPADTGVVYGFLSPLLVMARMRGLNVECGPMFLESGLRGAFRGMVQVRPLSVVGALAGFLLSRPVIRAVRAARRVRK